MIRLLLVLLLATPAMGATRPAAEAERGMVVSAHRLASEAGSEVLAAGGNAVDAAVATAFALAVVDPCCGNLGGGGFLTVHLADGREAFLDFRETAPAAATADMYAADPRGSLDGWRAVAVPASVAGLEYARARWGRLDRAVVLAPAIRLAQDGFALTRADTDIMAAFAERLRRDPEAARIFLRPDGSVPEPGTRLVQPDLAATLRKVARDGAAGFTAGPVAAAIAAGSRAGGGVLSEGDLAGIRPVERAPVTCAYRGWRIVTAAPPSSGGVALCQILGVLEGFDLAGAEYGSAAGTHLFAEAARHAFIDRNAFLGDPDQVSVPTGWLLSAAHLTAVRQAIDAERATPTATFAAGMPPHERPETTHLSVMDAEGNAVALTTTLNGGFGAAVVAPGTGVLMNDEMDDFTTRPGRANLFGLVQGAANAIAPGKRPLSSMAPTLVTRDGRAMMALGSPGGARIITIVAQVLIDLIDHGMMPQEAVDAPRVHQQDLPDRLVLEPRGLSPDTRERLRAMGHEGDDTGALGRGGAGDARAGAACGRGQRQRCGAVRGDAGRTAVWCGRQPAAGGCGDRALT